MAAPFDGVECAYRVLHAWPGMEGPEHACSRVDAFIDSELELGISGIDTTRGLRLCLLNGEIVHFRIAGISTTAKLSGG